MSSDVRPRGRTIPLPGKAALLDTLLDAVPALTVITDRHASGWNRRRDSLLTPACFRHRLSITPRSCGTWRTSQYSG
jgi:hypothetical protein